jgi:hypothetical protein
MEEGNASEGCSLAAERCVRAATTTTPTDKVYGHKPGSGGVWIKDEPAAAVLTAPRKRTPTPAAAAAAEAAEEDVEEEARLLLRTR